MKSKPTISVLVLVVTPFLYFLFASGFGKEEKANTSTFLSLPQGSPKDFTNCMFNEIYKPDAPNLLREEVSR